MSDAVALLLARLDDPKPNGRDRYRAACPVCGGKNKSTLSIGVGDSGACLVKCWKEGCSPEAIATAVGLELQDLFPPRESSASPMRRRRMLSASQCLDIHSFETTVVWTAAHNLANGHALTSEDLERLNVAVQRIDMLAAEVRA